VGAALRAASASRAIPPETRRDPCVPRTFASATRAVFADPDGGYLNRFYDASRGDVILNPFDPRAHTWNICGELTASHDVEQLARSLIPDHDGADKSCRGYARMFGSIRSVTGASLIALDYLTEQTGPPISVRGWVRTGRACCSCLIRPTRSQRCARSSPPGCASQSSRP